MGDGPLKQKFEAYAKEKSINAYFTGRLAYGEITSILKSCDLAVNPISSGAAQSIINKHADYAAAGLPVINTQESPEYRELLSNYKAGLNCTNNDPLDLAEKLEYLYMNESKRKEMAKNSRFLAEDKFDRSNTYKSIYNLFYK